MIPLTDMHRLYRSVKAMQEEAQLRCAKEMISKPDHLRHCFERSIDQFGTYSNVTQPFHPQRALVSPRPIGARFCRALMSGYRFMVERTLDFDFVDYEVVPSRTKPKTFFSNGSPATPEPRVDALLVNQYDRVPIVAEIKAGSDKTPFIALVQALAGAAQLATEKQRDRLLKQYPKKGFSPVDRQIDIYLIFVNPPPTGRFRHELRCCTKLLAADMAESRGLRRIALINAMFDPNLEWLRPDGVFESGRSK